MPTCNKLPGDLKAYLLIYMNGSCVCGLGVLSSSLKFILAYSSMVIYPAFMKLVAWAKKNGLSYKTAYRLFKAGKLPLPAFQLSTGTIIVEEQPRISFQVLPFMLAFLLTINKLI